MRKNQTVQGTFSKLFGRKHANPPGTSLYATNPPWIFTHEAPAEGRRDFGECALREGAGLPRAAPPPLGLRAALPPPGSESSAGREGGDAAGRGGEGTRWNLRTGWVGIGGRRRTGVSAGKRHGGREVRGPAPPRF